MRMVFKSANVIMATLTTISQVILAGCTILSFSAVILRYLFNHPISWSDEILVFSLVLLVMLAQGYLELNNEQLRMTALYNALSKKWKSILHSIRLIVTIVTGMYLGKIALEVTKNNYALEGSTATLHIPYWLLYGSVGIAFMTIIIGRSLSFYRFVKGGDIND